MEKIEENDEKVINYQHKVDPNEIESETSKSKESTVRKRAPEPKLNGKTRLNWKYIIFPIIGVLIIALIITLVIVFYPGKGPSTPIINEESEEANTDSYIIPTTDNAGKPDIGDLPDLGPIEEQEQYKIKTEVNDLKRIYVNQKYYEDIKIQGFLTQNIVDRKTNYDIYVISEIEADEKTKYFYNKIYLCAISIASECMSSEDEYCLPQKLVDLNVQDYSHVRVLNELENFENFPLPLCIFNITDNNVITSISCHKNLSETRVNSIVLDLYFFRPPGIKRFNEKEGNITITEFKEGENNKIRETNGGLCDVENALGSYCTTDLNTTKDSKGNLIAYDEVAFTNITSDEDNYYIKTKYTNLLDKTDYLKEMNQLNPEKYNETLFNIYPKIKDYMKYYEHFSLENFKELYAVSKGIDVNNKTRRNLDENPDKPIIINQEYLFNFSHYAGIQILLSVKDNAGYNSENMEASSVLEINDEKHELENLKQLTDIDKVMSKLISLSRAGNNLATALYKKIKENLNNISEIISINIPSLNNFVVYKELTDIFDSTFYLDNLKIVPFDIIEESNNLVYKLGQLYNEIDNGSLKSKFRILNDYIYQFNKQSHTLINNISNNLKDLGELITSPKQAISFISIYYMNHTSTSYVNTIKEAQNILMHYYINEKDLIIPEVEKILSQFENITFDSIKKQLNLVNILNNKLENDNLTINDANEEDYEKIIANLHNSNNYINNIIKLFKKKLKNEIDLKDGEDGFFISKYDIESNNETFNYIIDNSLSIAQNLDNNEYIDKTFDKIMTDFRQSFTSIIQYFDIKKEEKFPMYEYALQGGYFPESDQEKMSKDFKDLRKDVINIILNENNAYLNITANIVNKFLEENKDFLESIIFDLNSYFTAIKLEKLSNSYEEAFNDYLDKVEKVIKENKDLTNQYFNGMEGIITDNSKIIELLKNTPVNKNLPPKLSCIHPDHEHCWKYTSYVDSISSKSRAYGYINKYNIFRAKFDNIKEFVKDELHSNILEEYKSYINQLKETLHSFRSNKISDIYPKLSELYFIDSHLEKLDIFYSNLNKYISDDKFNNYFLPKLREYKTKEIEEIDNIKTFIENTNNKISRVSGTSNNYQYDFCTTYKRKKTYTCNNGDLYYYTDSDNICFESSYTNNYNNLKNPSFNSNKEFQKEYNDFHSFVKTKIEAYNNIIKNLKKDLVNAEQTILEKKMTNNYLSPIENKINSLLSEQFSDNLIKASYNFYKKCLDDNLENLLNNITNNWTTSFDILGEKVNKSLNNFKNSINEFGLLSLIYEAVISQNVTKYFFDSIIEHQKSELNYTISYYYNCLLQNITSVFQYIFNQIPTNQEGFNNILNKRKKEVEDFFSFLFKTIEESKQKALSSNRQNNVLEVSSSNFFNLNSILAKIKQQTSSILQAKGLVIFNTRNGKSNSELSLACRFYLENSLNGLQIEELYQPIYDYSFVDLNYNNFKKIISNNWIFDQDDFINKVNLSIYNSELEIQNDFKIEKESYKDILEKKITIIYSQEGITEKVNNQFNNQIKKIDNELVKKIKNKVQELLNQIKIYLSNEETNLKEKADSFTKNNSKLKEALEDYKEKIVNGIQEVLNKTVNNFYDNIYNNAYKVIIESGLNDFLNSSKNYIENCKTYETLESTYNIGNIMFDIVEDLVSEYKKYSIRQIELKRDEFLDKINGEAKINEIKEKINDELNPKISTLLKIINNNGNDNIGANDYDLSNNTKNEINTKIAEILVQINSDIIAIKGSHYDELDLEEWGLLDFDDINEYDQIRISFDNFINTRIKIEKSNTNNFIKEAIKSNFNLLINNLIKTFGKEFFERVMKYNENFKITSLYKNLKYSLIVSLQYYANLNVLKGQIESLTKDLKIKLYNLNNLDLIAKENNQKVLNILNEKADEFIEKSFQHIIADYKSYLKADASIQLAFNERIISSLNSNLEDVSSDLERDFFILLNEEFKNKLITSYTKVMNEQTNDMIQTVNELKQSVKSIFDDLFSLDIEQVLEETNYKMNVTLESINNYNTHFNSFKIPEELLNYIENYGDNVIQRSYDDFETIINKQTTNQTLTYLEQNSKDYEKALNADIISNFINNTYSSIKNDNIDNITNNIQNSYGIEKYPENLDIEINRIESRTLRRLNGEGTDNDIIEEYKEKVADKSIDENFHKLLNISENAIKFVESFEHFDKFEDLVDKYIKKLNISYKESLHTIQNAYEEKEMYQILVDELENLTNYSLDYYYGIKKQFQLLRSFIKESVKKVNNLLYQCANITYETFAFKYENISNDSEEIDKEVEKEKIEGKSYSKLTSYQNGEFLAKTDIKALKRKARFKFALITKDEGNIKKPKVIASVMNQISPENVNVEIYNEFGNCGKNIQKVEYIFENVNYTTNIDFDTQSTFINVTSLTDIKYQQTTERYKIKDEGGIPECTIIGGVIVCIPKPCTNNKEIIEAPSLFKYSKQEKSEPIQING